MSQPENNFDTFNAADYSLFGIRYLIVPAGQGPAPAPVPQGAVPILRTSLFQAYELPQNSYLQVGDTTGTITADRANIGSQTRPLSPNCSRSPARPPHRLRRHHPQATAPKGTTARRRIRPAISAAGTTGNLLHLCATSWCVTNCQAVRSGAELDRAVLHHLAQGTIRSLLTRVADAIAHLATPMAHAAAAPASRPALFSGRE
jgi:hypothetical protein